MSQRFSIQYSTFACAHRLTSLVSCAGFRGFHLSLIWQLQEKPTSLLSWSAFELWKKISAILWDCLEYSLRKTMGSCTTSCYGGLILGACNYRSADRRWGRRVSLEGTGGCSGGRMHPWALRPARSSRLFPPSIILAEFIEMDQIVTAEEGLKLGSDARASDVLLELCPISRGTRYRE